MNIKIDYKSIITHYGISAQLKHFHSEIYELTEAIIDHEWTKSELGINSTKHISEEIADVMVMLNEFCQYYNLDKNEIKEVMKYKVKRQLERIRKENEQC